MTHFKSSSLYPKQLCLTPQPFQEKKARELLRGKRGKKAKGTSMRVTSSFVVVSLLVLLLPFPLVEMKRAGKGRGLKGTRNKLARNRWAPRTLWSRLKYWGGGYYLACILTYSKLCMLCSLGTVFKWEQDCECFVSSD